MCIRDSAALPRDVGSAPGAVAVLAPLCQGWPGSAALTCDVRGVQSDRQATGSGSSLEQLCAGSGPRCADQREGRSVGEPGGRPVCGPGSC
eukprot:765327-Rhodomonas_salina.1